MLMPVRRSPRLDREPVDLRRAMRCFASSVCVITVDGPEGRTGCTATSVGSLSMSPPTLVFTLMGGGSTARALRQGHGVGVSLLAPDAQPVAQRFSGAHGESGEARFGDDAWVRRGEGAWTYADAVVQMACVIEEVLPRHGNVLVLARVREAVHGATPQAPLMYRDGRYC